LDRFLILLRLGYPAPEVEASLLQSHSVVHPLDALQPVVTRDEVMAMQTAVRRVRMDDAVVRYVVDIVEQTRRDERLRLGVSPRGSLMLYRAAQAAAFYAGRDYVIPDDIKKMAPDVLPHRVMLTSKAQYAGVSKEDIVREVLGRVKIPI